MAETFTIRTDDELDDALTYLGVTDEARNRTAVIRAAVLAYAEVRRQAAPTWPVREAKVYQQQTPDGGSRYVIHLPGNAA